MAQSSESVVFAFGAGEISPIYGARVDVEKTSTACRTVQNMKLGVFGYAERRAGLQFIDYAKESAPVVVLLDVVWAQVFGVALADLETNYDPLTLEAFAS